MKQTINLAYLHCYAFHKHLVYNDKTIYFIKNSIHESVFCCAIHVLALFLFNLLIHPEINC